MYKNAILILLTAMAMLLTGCVTHGETLPTSGENTPFETLEQAQATTEELVPGVIDNPFDDDEMWDNPGNSAAENDQHQEGNSGDSDSQTPANTTPPNAESQPEESQGGESSEEMTYEKYIAMRGDDQMAFFNTFGSVEEFVAWYNTAKEKYEAEHPEIEIENGEIDLDSLFGGN